LPIQNWRMIPNSGGRYYIGDSSGIIVSFIYKTPRAIYGDAEGRGGRTYCLRLESYVQTVSTAAALVLEAFVGRRPDIGPFQVDAAHLNGDVTNDALKNLAWLTRDDPERSSVKWHRAHSGERAAGGHRLTIEQVRAIRADDISTVRALADRFGVSYQTISQIRMRLTWKHVA